MQGQEASAPGGGNRGGDAGGSETDEELFVPRQRSSSAGAAGDAEDPEAADTVREALDAAHLAVWGEPGAAERLRDRFVTGALPAVWLTQLIDCKSEEAEMLLCVHSNLERGSMNSNAAPC